MRLALWFLVALVLSLCSVHNADACNRCGLFGNRCKYYAPTYYAAPYAAPAQANVYVVQNSYPAPLVAQGASQYVSKGGYQEAVLPFFDMNYYARMRLELKKADQQTAALDNERLNAMALRFAEIQAPAVERLAAGQAAQMVLRASGLDTSAQGVASSQAIVINKDAYGRTVIETLNTEQIQKLKALQQVGPPPEENGKVPLEQDDKYPMLKTFCFRCHGIHMAKPKGEFFLGDDRNVAKTMRDHFFEISTQVSSGKMPPADTPQPNKEQRIAVLDEIQRLIVSHTQVEGDPR